MYSSNRSLFGSAFLLWQSDTESERAIQYNHNILTKDTNSYRSHNLISGGVSAGVTHHRDADGPREVADVHLCLLALRHLECFIV